MGNAGFISSTVVMHMVSLSGTPKLLKALKTEGLSR